MVVVEELMELSPENFRSMTPKEGVTLRRATIADLDAVVAFYGNADEMTRTPPAVARPLQDTRVWVAEQGGQIVAAALTNAETQSLAMIGGVYTKPAARGQGLSQAVCSALCQDLIDAKLRPVLYWGKPAAGAVYRKLGFRPIGHWRAVWLEKKEQA
jgi:predicted GNAT family acetyltransferase